MNQEQNPNQKRVGTVGQIMLGSGRLAVPLGAMIIIATCGILWWISPNGPPWQPKETHPQNAILSENLPMLTRPSIWTTGITETLSLHYIQLGDNSKSDIFRVTYTRTVTGEFVLDEDVNQTHSPTTDELWPVLSPNRKTLAYFTVSNDGERNLYIQPANSNTRPTNLTKNTANNDLHQSFEIKLDQPPQWSEDSQWLLFLAEQTDGKGNTIRLYVVRVDSGQVLRQKTEGAQVLWVAWQNGTDLLYLARHDDGSLALYTQMLFDDNATLLSEVNLPESND